MNRVEASRGHGCRQTVLAWLLLAVGLTASAQESAQDPFGEAGRLAALAQLGWDMSKQLQLDFRIEFTDRQAYRERNANAFAAKLRRLGFETRVSSFRGAWAVTASKVMEPELSALIALGKQLDELAIDDYGRYQGWDSQVMPRRFDPLGKATLASVLSATPGILALPCVRMKQRLAQMQASGAAGPLDVPVLDSMIRSACECTPARVEALLGSAAPRELAAELSKQQLEARIKPIMLGCAATEFRATFAAGCAQRFKGAADAERFCRCMSSYVATRSDAEIAEFGGTGDTYFARLLDDEVQPGTPPERPRATSEYQRRMEQCKAE